MALSQEEILALPENMVSLFQRMERDIIARIAGHIGEIGKLNPVDISRLNQMQNLGFNLEEIQREIAVTMNRAQTDIARIFEEAARREYEDFKRVIDLSGRKWIPFNENMALQELVEQFSRAALTDFRNLSGTLGFVNTRGRWENLHNFYARNLDYAITMARTGQMSVHEAMHTTVRQMADSGITRVAWQSGHHRRLDSTIRMNILGGLAKLSKAQSEMIGEQIGADGMEITFHDGYRPTHDFGGQQFTMRKYRNDIVPLMEEPNCYHRSFPIIMNLSTPAYTEKELEARKKMNEERHEFEGRTYNRYEAEQKQRRYELAIRQQKDRINAFTALGDEETAGIAKGRLRQIQASYRNFSKDVGLKTKATRTGVYNRFNTRYNANRNAGVGSVLRDLDVLFDNPSILGNATPDEWYELLIAAGHNVRPLGQGSFKSILFNNGGGFRINWGGDRIFQYHPPAKLGRTHHHGKNAYYKIGNGVFGVKHYNLDGTPLIKR